MILPNLLNKELEGKCSAQGSAKRLVREKTRANQCQRLDKDTIYIAYYFKDEHFLPVLSMNKSTLPTDV